MEEFQNLKEMDPFILLSRINLKLRDFYSSLDILCEDLNISKEELIKVLYDNGYEYNASNNQFVSI
ncbi:DUF4250 domain-containing protein [Clostridium tarantellae]|uniref:DUF4250 domain-containing protein n=1 Tax=Clostridium tarantellae TaxID=39493 RepID=A0A6I1MM79_9CLOT|nr:DUF4250 domain-containing protein [Clostridium tarantellae]MPQ43217.1 DUF4250 domain-containing protein [Clostridium tarantellae]